MPHANLCIQSCSAKHVHTHIMLQPRSKSKCLSIQIITLILAYTMHQMRKKSNENCYALKNKLLCNRVLRCTQQILLCSQQVLLCTQTFCLSPTKYRSALYVVSGWLRCKRLLLKETIAAAAQFLYSPPGAALAQSFNSSRQYSNKQYKLYKLYSNKQSFTII